MPARKPPTLLNLVLKDTCWEMMGPEVVGAPALLAAIALACAENPNAGLLRPFEVASGPANETLVPAFGDVLREIWFPHTTDAVDCELGIREGGVTIAKFRSTGGAQNRVYLWRHGCQIPLLQLTTLRNVVVRAELPEGTPLTLLMGFVWGLHGELFDYELFLLPTGIVKGCVFAPLPWECSWPRGEVISHATFLPNILEHASSEAGDEVRDTAESVWQSWRPWDRDKIEILLAGWRARRTQGSARLLVAILCRMPRALLPCDICPTLLERCAVWECSHCPAVVKILKARVLGAENEWEELFWPFFGGTRECDLPQEVCCEWIP
uniref:Uncharacterized protein n=1 Tax=Marseillevirus LCMAC103 TaxID=2506604 RepID=A0A481YV56_9VIRU|nr:MAG: hypothetical protein LCMAC103_03230 [Marseillevirus LCMAC103]